MRQSELSSIHGASLLIHETEEEVSAHMQCSEIDSAATGQRDVGPQAVTPQLALPSVSVRSGGMPSSNGRVFQCPDVVAIFLSTCAICTGTGEGKEWWPVDYTTAPPRKKAKCTLKMHKDLARTNEPKSVGPKKRSPSCADLGRPKTMEASQ